MIAENYREQKNSGGGRSLAECCKRQQNQRIALVVSVYTVALSCAIVGLLH